MKHLITSVILLFISQNAFAQFSSRNIMKEIKRPLYSVKIRKVENAQAGEDKQVKLDQLDEALDLTAMKAEIKLEPGVGAVSEDDLRSNLEHIEKKLNNKKRKIKRLRNKVDNGKTIKRESNKNLYDLHTNIKNVKVIKFQQKETLKQHPIKTQALGGLSYVKEDANKIKSESGNFELGGKINTSWIRLPSRYKYEIEKPSSTGVLVRTEQIKYLDFSIISRGMLSIGDIEKTTSEYINTTLGSPVTVKTSFTKQLQNKSKPKNTGEPEYFIAIDFDSRLIPMYKDAKMDDVGFTFHSLPNFQIVFYGGENGNGNIIDKYVFQLSGNVALPTENLRENIFNENKSGLGNLMFSIEARLGRTSEEKPTRNWSFFSKYTTKDINGPFFTFGFSLTPQGKT